MTTHKEALRLPTWAECEAVVNESHNDKDAPKPTALQQFIYDHDDADPERSERFLGELSAVIKEALAQPEKPQLDRITTLRQLTENHSVDCLCADCVELDDIEEALAQPEQEPTNLERHKRNVQKFLGTQQPKEPEQDEYLSKAYRLANELRCHLAIAPAPQRTWVGLTDEETGHWAADFLAGAKWAEAKLKEKNA